MWHHLTVCPLIKLMQDITGSNLFVQIITTVPDKLEDNKQEHDRHKLVVQFIGEYLINVYGRARAKKWCRENKGRQGSVV